MFKQVCESITKEMTASASSAIKIKVVAPADENSSWRQTPPLRGSVVPAKLSAVRNPRHPFPEQHGMRRLRPPESQRQYCIVRRHEHVPRVSGHMTKELTASAPSAMKFKVVAPPDGHTFTVGAKRFRCAVVLFKTEVYLSWCGAHRLCPKTCRIHRCRHSFLYRVPSRTKVLSQLDLLRYWKETTPCKNDVYLLPMQLDEHVATLQLPALGAVLTVPPRNTQFLKVSRWNSSACPFLQWLN